MQSLSIFDYPERVRSRYLVAGGYSTHFLEAGPTDAPKVVLVHGSPMEIGMGSVRWHPTILPLADRFNVIAVDELGAGDTDAPKDETRLGNIHDRGDHLIAFLDALGGGPVSLIGQSQGAWLCAYVYIRRPELVRHLILIDTASASGSDGKGLPYFAKIFEPGTMIPIHDLTTAAGITAYLDVFLHRKEAVTPALLERLLPLAHKWNARYMVQQRAYFAGAMDRYSSSYDVDGRHISHFFLGFNVPTLFVWGRQSVKPIDPGFELFKSTPNSEMHVFDQANHFLWLDQPDAFVDLALSFLSRDR